MFLFLEAIIIIPIILYSIYQFNIGDYGYPAWVAYYLNLIWLVLAGKWFKEGKRSWFVIGLITFLFFTICISIVYFF